jgi:hypothetical protein
MTNTCGLIDTLRKPKLLDMSIFDWGITLFVGYLLAIYIFKLTDIYLILYFEMIIIVLGIITHKIFGVNTMLGYYIGLNPKPIRKECI